MVDIRNTNCPEAALDLWLGDAAGMDGVGVGDTEVDAILAVAYDYTQYYLPGAPAIELVAVYCLSGGQLYFSVAALTPSLRSQLDSMEASVSGLRECARANDLPVLALGKPLRLETVSIAKPWGQEIWYTGIEERGVSQVTDGWSSSPLPWVLSVAPERLTSNRERQINLLKILDPLPEAVYGDLYFELHEEKREVYVVTHIDKGAWPEGVGAIRYGFNEEVKLVYSSEEAFRADYLAAVKNYQLVRRQIDEQLELLRQGEGLSSSEPVSVEIMKRWVSTLPPDVIVLEETLRERMNKFTALLPLKPGDVVKVPLRTPHALQHGVRTVEFQSPVYERMILSFAQKVLTQSDWDTEKAVEVMSTDSPPLAKLAILEEDADHRIEEVVIFDDFRVLRLTLAGSAEYLLPEARHYELLLVVDGSLDCGGELVEKEHAVLLPAHRTNLHLVNNVNRETTLLLASPV